MEQNWYVSVAKTGVMSTSHRNRILKALPARESRLISAHLRPVVLSKDMVLYEVGQRIKQVYFPEEAVVSCLSGTSEGEVIEVAVVGNEGIVGVASLVEDLATFRAVVQIPGRAFGVNIDVLRKELARYEAVHRIWLHYTCAFLVQLAQMAVCNKFHSVEQRFCRWLLTAHDKTASPSIPMTQEALARVLGTRRASVSGSAGIFQRAGAIRYSRGKIIILNRKYLEAQACECYETITAAHGR
jgi:CRP-like cAMP-binding protein